MSAALSAAPPRNGAWLLAIEPLLRVQLAPEVWEAAMAALQMRAR